MVSIGMVSIGFQWLALEYLHGICFLFYLLLSPYIHFFFISSSQTNLNRLSAKKHRFEDNDKKWYLQ